MRMLAVVPARGGSKGLPGKNLAEIDGRSLVRMAVEVGRAAGLEVLVSSDSERILAEGRRCRALLDVRPGHLASDTAAAEEVARHIVEHHEADALVWLQPTSPFRLPDDVSRCVEALSSAPAVATASPVAHPSSWNFSIRADGTMDPTLGWERFVRRRQLATPEFALNGGVYAARTDHLRAGEPFVGPLTRIVEVPALRAIDIDAQSDLDLARALAPLVLPSSQAR